MSRGGDIRTEPKIKAVGQELLEIAGFGSGGFPSSGSAAGPEIVRREEGQ